MPKQNAMLQSHLKRTAGELNSLMTFLVKTRKMQLPETHSLQVCHFYHRIQESTR